DARPAQRLGGAAGEVVDVLLLLLLGRAHADAEDGDLRIDRDEGGDEARLGAGAAGRVHGVADLQAALVRLRHQLQRAIGIAERADGVRAAARDDVRLPARRAPFGRA